MGYIQVSGNRIWHEMYGDASAAQVPMVLLHGGFGGASSFGGQVPDLVAVGRQVYVPERPGHAHSPDLDEPFTYAGMATHTIDYLDQVVVGPADLVGWSDGAVVALLVALRRPDLVHRMVLIGQYYNSSGKVAATGLDDLLESADGMELLRGEYDEVSPDGPEHFAVVHAKTMHLFATEPEIDLAELSGVNAPTLVLQGDRDEVTVAHGQAVAEALSDGRLAVLPGTHLLPLEVPRLVNPLLIWFLDPGVNPATSLGF